MKVHTDQCVYGDLETRRLRQAEAAKFNASTRFKYAIAYNCGLTVADGTTLRQGDEVTLPLLAEVGGRPPMAALQSLINQGVVISRGEGFTLAAESARYVFARPFTTAGGVRQQGEEAKPEYFAGGIKRIQELVDKGYITDREVIPDEVA